MADELVNKGLELFASGDLAGAARLWLRAREIGDADPQLEAYLQHVAAVAPEALAAAKEELRLDSGVPSEATGREEPATGPGPAEAIALGGSEEPEPEVIALGGSEEPEPEVIPLGGSEELERGAIALGGSEEPEPEVIFLGGSEELEREAIALGGSEEPEPEVIPLGGSEEPTPELTSEPIPLGGSEEPAPEPPIALGVNAEPSAEVELPSDIAAALTSLRPPDDSTPQPVSAEVIAPSSGAGDLGPGAARSEVSETKAPPAVAPSRARVASPAAIAPGPIAPPPPPANLEAVVLPPTVADDEPTAVVVPTEGGKPFEVPLRTDEAETVAPSTPPVGPSIAGERSDAPELLPAFMAAEASESTPGADSPEPAVPSELVVAATGATELPIAPADQPLAAKDRSPAARADPWGDAAALGPAVRVAETSAGLSLVSMPSAQDRVAMPPSEVAAGEVRLKELLELDDFTGALEQAERLLAIEPEHELARIARQRCRDTLQRMYESKIGALAAVPDVKVPPDQVIWLDLDHRSGFILAQVDGTSTFEELIELTGMDRLEALRIMVQLVQKGVIGPA